MPTPSASELKALQKAVRRWREDMNDQAEELQGRIDALSGDKKKPKAKPDDDDDDKGGDADDDKDAEEGDSGFGL